MVNPERIWKEKVVHNQGPTPTFSWWDWGKPIAVVRKERGPYTNSERHPYTIQLTPFISHDALCQRSSCKVRRSATTDAILLLQSLFQLMGLHDIQSFIIQLSSPNKDWSRFRGSGSVLPHIPLRAAATQKPSTSHQEKVGIVIRWADSCRVTAPTCKCTHGRRKYRRWELEKKIRNKEGIK
jgi:hypothetical protein